MKINVSFLNMDHSESLEAFIAEKTKKLAKFFKSNDHIDWIISLKDKNFTPVLNLKFHGRPVVIHAKAENAFVAVSSVVDKAKRTLSKRHDRYTHH